MTGPPPGFPLFPTPPLFGSACRGGRARLREGQPPLHGAGMAADPALALPRERHPLDADEDRVRLLACRRLAGRLHRDLVADRKSTRLNSSHSQISYALFCLK